MEKSSNSNEIQIDEIVSIKELVKKITEINKWPIKDADKKKMHNSLIFRSGSTADLTKNQ
jgi:hypothetical protein